MVPERVLVSNHTLEDWLVLHGLDVSLVKEILSSLRPPRSPIRAQQILELSSEEAWFLASEALVSAIPDLSKDIEIVRDCCKRVLDASTDELPFTQDRGPDQAPFVSLNYRGTPSDVLCVAHEFGHALQYHLAKGEFIPPANRELAAFVSERVLLEHLSELQIPLEDSWSDDNWNYFGEDVDQLRAAIEKQDTPYIYRWNYPLSRFVSEVLFDELTKTEIVKIFRGTIVFRDLVEKSLQTFHQAEIDNYLPAIPTADTSNPALEAYRSLGIMVLLDLEAAEEEENIESYYSKRLKHMQNGSAQIILDDLHKPIGYAAWDRGFGDSGRACLVHQSNPFGNQSEFQNKLEDTMSALADCGILTTPEQNPMRWINEN